MRQSIEWHRNCLGNRMGTAERQKKELEVLKKEITKSEIEIEKYQQQILIAIKRDKAGFDRERFLNLKVS